MNHIFYFLIIISIYILYILYQNKNVSYNSDTKYIDLNFYKNCDIYVINLVKNKDKLESFYENYYNSDLSNKELIVYPAVVGKDLDLVKYVSSSTYNDIIMTETKNIRDNHTKFTRGAVGCYLSHLNIMKQIANSDKDYGIVFEDDATIHPQFYANMMKKMKNIPNDWDILLLGGICMNGTYYNDYVDVKNFYGTECYIIKKQSAIKIVRMLNKLIELQIDAELVKLNKNKKIKLYQIYPVLVYQFDLNSDIQINTKYTTENMIEYFNIIKNSISNNVNRYLTYN